MTESSLPVCVRAEKAIYASERAAKRAIKALKQNRRDGGGFLHAYRCGGHWHVGHGTKAFHRIKGRKLR